MNCTNEFVFDSKNLCDRERIPTAIFGDEIKALGASQAAFDFGTADSLLEKAGH